VWFNREQEVQKAQKVGKEMEERLKNELLNGLKMREEVSLSYYAYRWIGKGL